MARLTIDGKEIEVPDGTSLFDACAEARGEPLPHFCYHPDLPIAGVCRLCQVEVEGMPKLTIACNTTVRDDMVVHTRSEKVLAAVKRILEMHLIHHPVDCPICDQSGECGLQDQYMKFGLYESRFDMAEKHHKAKAEVIGPQVILDKERCVLCSRCVRFCREVTGTGEMGIFNRGDRAEIGVAPGRELDNPYSLNTVDICPVGALTSRDFRFQKRVWMLKSVESICPGCATGCNIRIDFEGDRIYRLKPRLNREVNGNWMCDRGRMEYKRVHDEKRLREPLGRRDGQLVEQTWPEIGDKLVAAIGGAKLVILSPQQTLEEMWLCQALLPEAEIIGGVAGSDMGEGDQLLIDADKTPNRRGLRQLGIPEMDAGEIARKIGGLKGPVLIYGGDPAAADSALESALAAHDDVVYLGTHLNATGRLASLAAPVSIWAEKDGLFVNRRGRLQQIRRAVAVAGHAREDWRLLAEAGAGREGFEAPAELREIRRGLAAALGLDADTDLDRLPATGILLPAGGDTE